MKMPAHFWSSRGHLAKVVATLVLATSLTACSFSSVVKIAIATLQLVNIILENRHKPPASDLAYFDAADVVQSINLTNMNLAASIGDVRITITDEITGAVLGQNTYPYVVSGSTVSFANPAPVTSWIRSFSNYQGGAGFIEVIFETELTATIPPPGSVGVASSSTSWNGVPLASSQASYYNPGPGNNPCELAFCQEQ